MVSSCKNTNGVLQNNSTENVPSINYKDLTDEEVTRRTSFRNKAMLLLYIVLVCNGSFDKMTTTLTSLIWFDEWFLYLEVHRGRTLSRWIDSGKSIGKYDDKLARNSYHHKESQVLACRESWPKYC